MHIFWNFPTNNDRYFERNNRAFSAGLTGGFHQPDTIRRLQSRSEVKAEDGIEEQDFGRRRWFRLVLSESEPALSANVAGGRLRPPALFGSV